MRASGNPGAKRHCEHGSEREAHGFLRGLSMSVEYSMRISRLTVDKLGVKLHDKVSAVIAELIANAYTGKKVGHPHPSR